MYKFTCSKCGGQFYSKVDMSNWTRPMCNKCAGKPYKDYPVEDSKPTQQPTYNNVPPTKIEKKEFDLESYITDMILVYSTLSVMCDQAKLTIPIENLCNWTTSIMIQKEKVGR